MKFSTRIGVGLALDEPPERVNSLAGPVVHCLRSGGYACVFLAESSLAVHSPRKGAARPIDNLALQCKVMTCKTAGP